MIMIKMSNTSLLQFVHDLMHNFDGMYELNYKQPISEYENWITIKDEELAAYLAKIFKNNTAYSQTVCNMAYQMDEFVVEQISEDTICCNRGWAPFLTLKGFQYYKDKKEKGTVCYYSILESVFNREDFNDWADEETNFDFPTKELLKQGVKAVYDNSTRGFANGVDYAYLDVISYLTEFFKSYSKHMAHCDDED